MNPQQQEPLNYLNEYAKTTKSVSLCITCAILLIFVFVISPLKNRLILSSIVKIIIILILAYALFINTASTWTFSKNTNLFAGGWNSLKTNILGSYIFSLFIFFLILSILRKGFQTRSPDGVN